MIALDAMQDSYLKSIQDLSDPHSILYYIDVTAHRIVDAKFP